MFDYVGNGSAKPVKYEACMGTIRTEQHGAL